MHVLFHQVDKCSWGTDSYIKNPKKHFLIFLTKFESIPNAEPSPYYLFLLTSLAAVLWNYEILSLGAIVYTVSNPLTCLHTYWQPLHAPEG